MWRGNIGLGKSTFLEYSAKYNNIQICPEPVKKWTNFNNINLLQLIYDDPKKWAFHFQSYVALTFMENSVEKSEKQIQMMERSIYSARHCFVKCFREQNMMDEASFNILQKMYDFGERQFNAPNLMIYLRTSPETSLARNKSRNRTEEKDVSLDRLKILHQLHEQWISKINEYPVVIDASLDKNEIQAEYEKCLN